MSLSQKYWWTNLSVVLLFIIDRILKLYFVSTPGAGRVFISGILSFRLEKNLGIAFGLNVSQVILIPIVIAIIVLLIFYLIKAYQEKDSFLYFVLTLILIGAFSNLIDRIKFGGVIDYIDVPFFTVFNLADAMITVGVAIILFDRLKVLLKK